MSGVQLTENLIKTLDGGGKDDDSSFIPAPGGFQGPRDGYIFQNGEAGVGYYREEIFAAKEDDDDDDEVLVNDNNAKRRKTSTETATTTMTMKTKPTIDYIKCSQKSSRTTRTLPKRPRN